MSNYYEDEMVKQDEMVDTPPSTKTLCEGKDTSRVSINVENDDINDIVTRKTYRQGKLARTTTARKTAKRNISKKKDINCQKQYRMLREINSEFLKGQKELLELEAENHRKVTNRLLSGLREIIRSITTTSPAYSGSISDYFTEEDEE